MWTIIAFLLGSLPFSVWIGRLAGRVEIRDYGDGNPGSSNVVRSLGWRWGSLAMLLDFLKGAIPVGLAWFFLGLDGWYILPVALAPILGHAFSPWLGWQGGKAVAVTFGVWTGLTLGVAPTVLGLLLAVMFAVFTASGWAMILAMILFGVFITTYYRPLYPEFIAIWAGNFLVLLYKHFSELKRLPAIRKFWFRFKTKKQQTRTSNG